jgi:small-conductance mechanosensitive channel
MGIDITALVAGLGVGGIAVALAAQNILGDLFASWSIVLDKPFLVGDFIIIDGYSGTVEHIGLKTTRLRSLTGEQLIFSNSDLLKCRIRNYKRMQERRIVFSFGVLYETPLEKLKEIPGIVKDIITSIENTRFDRAHFASYGNYSLNFEVVYYVLSSDYTVYMDIQQKINLALFEEFQKKDIVFAYPTQTIYVSGAEPISVSLKNQPSTERLKQEERHG